MWLDSHDSFPTNERTIALTTINRIDIAFYALFNVFQSVVELETTRVCLPNETQSLFFNLSLTGERACEKRSAFEISNTNSLPLFAVLERIDSEAKEDGRKGPRMRLLGNSLFN